MLELTQVKYQILKKMKQISIVRKISIGSDYKDNAMHYAVGQIV